MRTFARSHTVLEPNAREVNGSVARLLDEISISGGSEQLANAPPSPARGMAATDMGGSVTASR
jgi:hypothetical protein